MKHYVATIVLALSGCATSPTFDNNEYSQLVWLHSVSNKTLNHCIDRPLMVQALSGELLFQVNNLATYAKYSHNKNHTKGAYGGITSLITELNLAYSDSDLPSDVYCVAKINTIIENIEILLQTIVKKT